MIIFPMVYSLSTFFGFNFIPRKDFRNKQFPFSEWNVAFRKALE